MTPSKMKDKQVLTSSIPLLPFCVDEKRRSSFSTRGAFLQPLLLRALNTGSSTVSLDDNQNSLLYGDLFMLS